MLTNRQHSTAWCD